MAAQIDLTPDEKRDFIELNEDLSYSPLVESRPCAHDDQRADLVNL